MNTISWFLYAVDVVGSLGEVTKFIIAACIALIIAQPITKAWHGDFGEGTFKPIIGQKCLLVIISVLLFITVALPSQKTMYLILGSEVGEEVVNSETGQRVQNAINKKLDEYLGESNE